MNHSRGHSLEVVLCLTRRCEKVGKLTTHLNETSAVSGVEMRGMGSAGRVERFSRGKFALEWFLRKRVRVNLSCFSFC